MSHRHDYWERIRSWFIPKLGALVQKFNESTGYNLYVEAGTTSDQFVGMVNMSEEELEKKFLHEAGYERNPLAAWKHLVGSGKREEGSFRLIKEGSRKQVHIILFDAAKYAEADTSKTFIYAHYEYRWDTDPIKHYKGVDYSAEKGVNRARQDLRELGIEFETDRKL